jgi:hypothetical protein
VTGFGASALLVQDLRGPEAFDPVRHQAALRRLTVMLSLQLGLMLGLTLALR